MGNNPVKFSYKQIWFIAYPILISLVMEQLIGMTDTAFMGRVGEVELGASAIAGVYYMTFYMIAFGFSLGAQIIMGRRNGEGNYAKIGPIFYKGSYFLLGVALVLFVSSHFVSPLILERFIDSPHVHEAAVSYIRWRVYGFFFSCLYASRQSDVIVCRPCPAHISPIPSLFSTCRMSATVSVFLSPRGTTCARSCTFRLRERAWQC